MLNLQYLQSILANIKYCQLNKYYSVSLLSGCRSRESQFLTFRENKNKPGTSIPDFLSGKIKIIKIKMHVHYTYTVHTDGCAKTSRFSPPRNTGNWNIQQPENTIFLLLYLEVAASIVRLTKCTIFATSNSIVDPVLKNINKGGYITATRSYTR